MASCESYMWELVRNIEPTQSQKEGAQRSHSYLREILSTGNMADRILDSYLSGSYKRDTAIRPLDDVDVVFIVDPSKWQVLPFMPTLPSTVLKTFADAIRYRYPVSSVFGQSRSVRLQLYHLDIDVVPGIIANLDNRIIKVPDRHSDTWILSAPKIHEQKATEVNTIRNGKFKPLVKLLKFWNSNLPSTANFKSFAVETIAVKVFSTISFDSLEQGLLYFFDFIVYLAIQRLTLSGVLLSTVVRWNNACGISFGGSSCEVPDVAGTGSNIAADVDEERKRRFIDNAILSRDRMKDALNSVNVDTAYRRVKEALKM